MKKFVFIVLGITICFVTGLCAGIFQSASIETWYPTLVKSTFTPPNRCFYRMGHNIHMYGHIDRTCMGQ